MELSILAVMQNLYQNGAINSQLLVHHHSKFRNFTRIKENNAIGGGGSTAKTVLKNTPAKFQASLCKMQNMPLVGGSQKNFKIACIANPTTPEGITIKSLGFDHLEIWEVCRTPVKNRNIVTITDSDAMITWEFLPKLVEIKECSSSLTVSAFPPTFSAKHFPNTFQPNYLFCAKT